VCFDVEVFTPIRKVSDSKNKNFSTCLKQVTSFINLSRYISKVVAKARRFSEMPTFYQNMLVFILC
jgi:hypothetical protein